MRVATWLAYRSYSAEESEGGLPRRGVRAVAGEGGGREGRMVVDFDGGVGVAVEMREGGEQLSDDGWEMGSGRGT
jgi:hypothetical protein